jgi:probable FeS assembly SUF system protein SufT
MRYQEVVTTRDCQVVQIPSGNTVLIPADTSAVITQALGDSFTIEIPSIGGMYRVAGADADAIGKERPVPAGEAAETGPVSEARIWSALRNVYDPEIPVNVVELGLVYDLRIEPLPAGGSRLQVQMTLTAPGCGMGQIIADEAKRLIEEVPGVIEADVQVVFDPPWNQQMMSEGAKLQLGFD